VRELPSARLLERHEVDEACEFPLATIKELAS